MIKITADYILNPQGNWWINKCLILSEEGRILDIQELTANNKPEMHYYPGIILPGFVNAHCHLELSHMKGKAATGTGLIPFIKTVVQQRAVNPEEIQEAIVQADAEMYKNGIVAVGDICNQTDTLSVKLKSKIQYYNFIEAFDFMQDSLAESFYDQYKIVFDAFGDVPKSFVPHAAYSVSQSLFKKLIAQEDDDRIVSIHNQELEAEDALFIQKDRRFPDFFESVGFSFEKFSASGKPSIYYPLSYLNPRQNNLFVHNTMMQSVEVEAVKKWSEQAYFVTCPNANLYIENRLPVYENFKLVDDKMCIGTDSLTSNWQLSILEEVKTILKYASYLQLSQVLNWATQNGANALKMNKSLGSFEIGKQPGVNWIQGVEKINEVLNFKPDAVVSKII